MFFSPVCVLQKQKFPNFFRGRTSGQGLNLTDEVRGGGAQLFADTEANIHS